MALRAGVGRGSDPVALLLDHRPRAVRQGGPRFSVIVLAASDLPLPSGVDAALRAVGAIDVRYATSPADLLRGIPIPAEIGIGIICRSARTEPVLQLIGQLRQRGWRRLLVACAETHADTATIRLAIAAKVRCLIKQPAQLRDASGQWLPSAVRRALPGGQLGLSHREVQVLQAVADGHTNNEIGELLGVSGLTVKSHLARIGRKTGTGDRAEMVASAMRAGLVA